MWYRTLEPTVSAIDSARSREDAIGPPSRIQDGEGSHGKASHSREGGGNGEEAEAGGRKGEEVAEVLDDRDACLEKQRVGGPLGVGGVVDIEGIDADERGTGGGEERRGGARHERMAVAVGGGSPVSVPAGVQQHGFAAEVVAPEKIGVESPPRGEREEDAREICEAVQRQPGDVCSLGETVEGSVHVGAGVGDEVHAGDREGRSRRVVGGGGFAGEELGNRWPG